MLIEIVEASKLGQVVIMEDFNYSIIDSQNASLGQGLEGRFLDKRNYCFPTKVEKEAVCVAGKYTRLESDSERNLVCELVQSH